MKKEWIAWTVGVALGVGLSVAGCGDKKREGGASSPSVELAPPATEEKSGSGAALPPGASDHQGPSASSNERDRELERKSPRG